MATSATGKTLSFRGRLGGCGEGSDGNPLPGRGGGRPSDYFIVVGYDPKKLEISIANCVFPFIYGDKLHYNCISIRSDFDWCSLDFHFKGRWRYCTALDPPMCIFPFQFRKKSINECTKEGYILNRSWCSLTDNYNKDRKWKQCSPYNF
ncbi:binder of sperm protein homolog 2-like isoform X2 [Psammomys obesus]|uniref:binder of sperm protein homolog 2-like isoform X2 n=1 Tax=Psammomys obesus TaxID=48139 RepID=UPI002452AD3F|nr:binder of sperm protein homolog 2-like isoform X2 [Psammomys obesus]